MPEGPSIVVFKKKIERFEGKTVTESGGYNNPFADEISGKKLVSIKTYGKYLLLDFEDFLITVHFGLFGSFLVNDSKKVNASFSLFFGDELINFYVVKIKKFGKDYEFDQELNVFSKKYRLEKTKKLLLEKYGDRKIGDVLLNQDVFPGLGNIIRNEVLFLSKIHPESTVEKIPSKKMKELLQTIKEFSKASVELIEQKIWKSSSSVYKKKEWDDQEVLEYVAPKIKRKTYVVEKVQKIY
ncbi:DNA-formamidopyrimidine glycosylase family protein [Chryseobacterium gotjawalense]|uniref:DNA-formamidopyrimidine glycosylase family protein n=1 Tax=Chryseobacterium gotjawalense TaxID=3042315 RepID=A0ABY8RGY3_9FLAO|nr:DNA-formamidopyrimidine glycosylase family protein [Chryseobacterium sp. wdc7]WHF52284.1 DNA-formamidopyrimidine glycosylase family protein [Chryseobacterium sp. wdc7]